MFDNPKVGDRVSHKSGHEAIVTGLHPTKGGVHLVWLDDPTAWVANEPVENLELIARAIYMDDEQALLIQEIDDWTQAVYPPTPLTDDEMRTARNAASRLFIKLRALLSGETESVSVMAAGS